MLQDFYEEMDDHEFIKRVTEEMQRTRSARKGIFDSVVEPGFDSPVFQTLQGIDKPQNSMHLHLNIQSSDPSALHGLSPSATIVHQDGGLRSLEFDAEPYFACFDQIENRLIELKSQANERIAEIQDEVTEKAGDHKSAMEGYQKKLYEMFARFKRLDIKIARIARTIVQIGDNLEMIHQQEQLCIKGKEVIQHFLDFHSGDEQRIDPLFSSKDPHDVYEAASLIQTLYTISKEIRSQSVIEASQTINKTAANIEQFLMQDFFDAHERSNIDKMKEIADVLLRFEGQRVNSQFIFHSIAPLNALTTPSVTSIEDFASACAVLCDKVSYICSRDYFVIYKVFPRPENVIRLLVQRIFQDSLNSFFDIALKPSNFSSSESHLLVIESAFDFSLDLLSKLKSPLQALPPSLGNAVELFLDDQFESIFHLHRSQYIDKELDYFKSKIDKNVESLLERAKGSERDTSGWFNRIKGKGVGVVLSVFERSMERCEKLSDHKNVSSNVQKLFLALLKAVCAPLLGKVLRVVGESKEKQFDPFWFDAISFVNKSVLKMEKLFESKVSKLLSSSLTVHKQSINQKAAMLSTIEQQVLGLLQKMLDTVLSSISKTLTKEQKNRDYRPKDESMMADGTESSKACVLVCDIVRRHGQYAFQSLEGRNLDTYLREFGFAFYETVLDHLRKFVVNEVGALLLMKDIREYQETVQTFHLPVVEEKFEVLQHLVNIFAVPRESIPMLIADDPKLAAFPAKELDHFIRLRVDM